MSVSKIITGLMDALSVNPNYLTRRRAQKIYITLFHNVSQADYWVFNMILLFDYRKKLSWWLSKKILCISSMNLTASLKLPAKETSSLLGNYIKLINFMLDTWTSFDVHLVQIPWCNTPNPLTSQGIQKIILLSKSTARIVTRHYCNISAINSPHPCKEVSLLYLIETPCSLWVVSLRLSPLRFLCLIHRRPSGNPDKDICDHIMQVKLAYKEQLSHILHEVKLHWIWGVS